MKHECLLQSIVNPLYHPLNLKFQVYFDKKSMQFYILILYQVSPISVLWWQYFVIGFETLNFVDPKHLPPQINKNLYILWKKSGSSADFKPPLSEFSSEKPSSFYLCQVPFRTRNGGENFIV